MIVQLTDGRTVHDYRVVEGLAGLNELQRDEPPDNGFRWEVTPMDKAKNIQPGNSRNGPYISGRLRCYRDYGVGLRTCSSVRAYMFFTGAIRLGGPHHETAYLPSTVHEGYRWFTADNGRGDGGGMCMLNSDYIALKKAYNEHYAIKLI